MHLKRVLWTACAKLRALWRFQGVLLFISSLILQFNVILATKLIILKVTQGQAKSREAKNIQCPKSGQPIEPALSTHLFVCCWVISMSWKSLMRLAFALFFGSLAAVPVVAPVLQKRIDLPFHAPDYSSQRFSNLSADEINRRTLKAAAAINTARR